MSSRLQRISAEYILYFSKDPHKYQKLYVRLYPRPKLNLYNLSTDVITESIRNHYGVNHGLS
jgi:hypothetical protein